jgi:hypothetical protein
MSELGDNLGAALRDIIDHALTEVHTAIPGKVISYDASTQTCAVQVMVKRVIVDDDGNEIVESLPQITNVPVGWYSGGGYFMSLPMASGDYCMLMFQERPVDTFLSSGEESDPGDLRHHDLSDCWAIPCVRPTSKALQSADASVMTMGKDGGPIIAVDAAVVNIGEKSAAAFIARADLVDTRIGNLETSMSTYVTAMNAHTHLCAAPGSPSGPPVPLGVAPTAGSTTAATKGKVT